MIFIRADFAKSYIEAHTRTLPSGKVIQVHGFTNKRYKQAERDHDTMDMFKPDLPAPKKPIPIEAAKHPEDFTPDIFSGETKGEKGKRYPFGEYSFKTPLYAALDKNGDVVDWSSGKTSMERKHPGGNIVKVTKENAGKFLRKPTSEDLRDQILASKQPVAPAAPAQAATKPVASEVPNPRTLPWGEQDTKNVAIEFVTARGRVAKQLHPSNMSLNELLLHYEGSGFNKISVSDEAAKLLRGKLSSDKSGFAFLGTTSTVHHLRALLHLLGAIPEEEKKYRFKEIPGIVAGLIKSAGRSLPLHNQDRDEFIRNVKHYGSFPKDLDDDIKNEINKELIHQYDITAKFFGWKGHMTKSFPAGILFFKSHVKQYTDKNGRMVKEHDDKRAKKMAQAGPGRAQSQAEPGSAHGYGHHNVEAGDRIKFKAGDFAGAGTVKSVGQDGVTVTDESGRDHNVHWGEVMGRGGKDGGGKKPPGDDAKPVADAPDPPEKKPDAEPA
jgi:hypothetical protein